MAAAALGMTRRKVGRTSGFRECPLTLRDAKRNLSAVRRREPAEPQASAERCERGKPQGKPQGEPEGSRENAARRDRGPAASPARGGAPERARESDLRWSVVRHGGFPGATGAGLGRGLSDTTPARCQRVIVDVAPRSTGGFGRTVTRGCVASGRTSRRSVTGLTVTPPGAVGDPSVGLTGAQRRPEAGRAFTRGDLAVHLGLDQRQVVGMGDADAAAPGRQDGEGAGAERPGHDLGQEDL